MADRQLLITWSRASRGREERALEVFNEAMGILGRYQQEGRIEKFDVALMEPNGLIGGYIAIQGSAEQIASIRAEEEFRRNTVDSELAVEDICHTEGVCNEGVAREMGMFQEALGKVPQRA